MWFRCIFSHRFKCSCSTGHNHILILCGWSKCSQVCSLCLHPTTPCISTIYWRIYWYTRTIFIRSCSRWILCSCSRSQHQVICISISPKINYNMTCRWHKYILRLSWINTSIILWPSFISTTYIGLYIKWTRSYSHISWIYKNLTNSIFLIIHHIIWSCSSWYFIQHTF